LKLTGLTIPKPEGGLSRVIYRGSEIVKGSLAPSHISVSIGLDLESFTKDATAGEKMFLNTESKLNLFCEIACL
jgi:hypothetical protein